ncbi:hypothetical protein WG904_19005 [Pedobacter sp. Du54]|uniref:hypothetical protein n=1 Tax=Pedobacter anseongensis TaxID=3133439 RepID=UPI00309F62FA
MKKKITLIIILTAATTFFAAAQSAQFRYRVKIQKKHKVIQDITTKNADSIRLAKGTVINSQKKFKVNEIEYTADYKDTLKQDQLILTSKDIPIAKSLEGRATIAIDKDDKSKLHINYWLGSKYERDGKYYIKLANRQYASFRFSCLEGGALTIPFKYTPEFTKNTKQISSQFTADLNVGLYMGISFGKIKYMYRKNEDKEPSKWLVSIGPFLSASRVEIDSTNTLSALEPLKIKQAIGAVSPGVGIMTSISNFRFGLFVGKDIAFGTAASKWDYNKRYWWGFGFGYNLGLLWAPIK